jgi:excisionase family DNA binding protein
MTTTEAATDSGIITKQQAADALGISVRKLEYLIKDGALPVTRLGRRVLINRRDVLALVPAQLPTPKDPTP